MMRWIGRTALSVLGGAVLLGTAWWTVYDARQAAKIRELEQQAQELKQIVSRLETQRRVAQVFVSNQERDAGGNVLGTRLDFKEFDRDGRAMPVRVLTVPGDVVYVDALVVRFTDKYVEGGDSLRGHSLHLFRRVFGESQRPSDGQALDKPNEVPAVYRTKREPSPFERDVWAHFWDYASNPDKAADAGVRVAQGEAVYQRVRTGQAWQLSTRADGGLEFKPQAIDPLLQPHLQGTPAQLQNDPDHPKP